MQGVFDQTLFQSYIVSLMGMWWDPIKRTTDANGHIKDEIVLSPQDATEVVRKLQEAGVDTARMFILDAKDEVSEINLSINKEAIQALQQGNINLEIYTENARIVIPKDSVNEINEDLYFQVVPLKEEQQKNEVAERAKQEEVLRKVAGSLNIHVLGRPMTIETNMPNQPVDIILPLKGVTIPEDEAERAQFFNKLGVFIEHSDGEKVFIKGEVVPYKDGQLGLKFTVNKFSTFTLLSATEPKEKKIVPYIQGYPDGTFKPNASVTRAQMATMLARFLTNGKMPTAQATFEDTEKNTSKDAIEFVKQAGLFNGVTETTFNPNGTITRAQMASVIARWIDETCAQDDSKAYCQEVRQGKTFADVPSTHWASQAIDKVSALGIMTGNSATTFNPNGALTRAQAVKVLNKLFERPVLEGITTSTFKDVPAKHWAIGDIEAAATEMMMKK